VWLAIAALSLLFLLALWFGKRHYQLRRAKTVRN
jgi:hypothetical protein